MKGPTKDGVKASVVNLVNLGRAKIFVAALPADNVEQNNQAEDAEASSTTPVDKGITEKEVLDNCSFLSKKCKLFYCAEKPLLSSFQPHIRRPT